MRISIRQVGRVVVVAVAAALTLTAPVAARESVDPATLNPPPPPEFNPTCERSGRGVTCSVAFSDPTLVDEPSAVFCDGVELTFSQDRSVVGKRFYDADGNLLQRHFREMFVGSYTNPVTGLSADFTAHNTIIHDLATPGDIASGQTRISGNQVRFFQSGGGATILLDAGRLVIDEGTGELLSSSGPKHFDDYFINGNTEAIAPLCDALD